MRTKITVILLVLNAALFAYIFYFEGRIFGSDEQAAPSKRIFQSQAAEIDYLRIEGPNIETSHVLEREREQWRIVSPVNWPANRHAVSRIVNRIQLMEAETGFSTSRLERTEQSLADYGLEEPRITLTFGHGGRRHTILLGDTATETGNRLYLLDPDRDRIHVVNREIADVLGASVEDLRSDSIFEIPLFEVRSLTLELTDPRNLKMRIVRSDDAWHFETPIQVRADRSAVEATVNNLSEIKVRRFEGEISGDLVPYGLNEPSMRITLDGNMRSQSLLIGDEVADASGRREYYAQMPGGTTPPTVFTITADRVDELKDAQDTLRSRDFLRFDPESLNAITIGVPEREPVSLQRLETGRWQLVTRQPDESIRLLRADNAIVDQLIERLDNLRARSFESDAPSAADIEDFGLTEPQRTVTLNDGRETTLRLGYFSPTRANEIYAKIDGSDFIYTVDSSILEALPVISRYYRDRLLMSRPEGAKITSVVLYSLERDTELFNISLPSGDTTWEAVLEEAPEATRDAVLSLLPELRHLRVENYILNEFPPILDMGRESRSWIYVLETTYALTGGEDDQTTYFELYLTSESGGQTMLVGSPELNVVFSARQPFIEAVRQLIDQSETAPPPAEAAPPEDSSEESAETPAQS